MERLQQLGVSAVLSVDAARPPLFELEMADVGHSCPVMPAAHIPSLRAS